MDLRDLFFPKNCLLCNKQGSYICAQCLLKVPKARQKCPVCNWYSFKGKTHPSCKKNLDLDGHFALWKYGGAVRKGIHAFKYRFASDVAGEFVNYIIKSHFEPKSCLLVPIPLHTTRHNWRGFNQSELIASKLAEKTDNNYAGNLLIRSKKTTPQAQLGKKERLQNLRGKFALNKEYLDKVKDYKTIVIVDDVWTTGSTIKEAAKVLKKAGAKNVWGFTLAR